MKFTANNRTFTIIPADTRAAAELAALLPLNLDMRDHAGNEKYADLPRRLSADDQAVRRIETGDVMLWQGDTLVVFYKNFDTPYRYTRLGKIQDTNGLQETLGSGSVKAQLGQ